LVWNSFSGGTFHIIAKIRDGFMNLVFWLEVSRRAKVTSTALEDVASIVWSNFDVKHQIDRAGAYDGSAVTAWLDHSGIVVAEKVQCRPEENGDSSGQTAVERRGGSDRSRQRRYPTLLFKKAARSNALIVLASLDIRTFKKVQHVRPA